MLIVQNSVSVNKELRVPDTVSSPGYTAPKFLDKCSMICDVIQRIAPFLHASQWSLRLVLAS